MATPDEIKKLQQRRSELASLLMKELAFDYYRHGDNERTKLLHEFCMQAVRDSADILQGGTPRDIVEEATCR